MVHRWPGRCFEYANFTDDEVATAMTTIHPTCGGLARPGLVHRISAIRARSSDVEDVWDTAWAPKPTKLALTETLWPILKKKIDDARWSETKEIPRVAVVVNEPYLLAQESTFGTYVIRVADDT